LLDCVYQHVYRINTLLLKYKFNYWQNATRLKGGSFNLLQEQIKNVIVIIISSNLQVFHVLLCPSGHGIVSKCKAADMSIKARPKPI